MNTPLIVIGVLWLATAVLFARWRILASGAESMPVWLRLLITASLGSVLWGFTLLAKNAPVSAAGGMRQLFAVAAYILGLGAMFVIWHRDILELFASPITSVFDGGSQSVTPKPFYAHATAYRRRGDYESALTEVQAQLQKFPSDLEGWLLWAEIQSDNLQAPEAALVTVRTYLERGTATPGERVQALLREADLLLFKLQDRTAARIILERIVDEFPTSDAGRLAAQRLSHLPTAEHLATSQSRDRKPLTVVRHEAKLGLSDDLGASQLAAQEQDLDAEIQDLVVHLVEQPDDWERRERLAKLYLEHLHRPDLAHEQLERLIVTPGQPNRQVVRWLNQVADLHLEDPNGLLGARLALDRIITRFPKTAAADLAERRLSQLKLEQRGQQPTKTLKLGQYPDRIGLESAHRFRPLRANLPDLEPDPEPDERK